MSTEWHDFQISNLNNLRLAALLHSGARNDKIVVVCHGFTGSKEGGGRALQMGEQLATLGFDTLLFDFAGCGASEGSWSDLTLSGQSADLGAVIAWCRKKGYNKIVLNGRSFGGSTVINYCAGDEKISALCTWAAVARPAKLFAGFIEESTAGEADDFMRISGEHETLFLKKRFFHDLESHDILRDAGAISPSSFLIVHGSEDEAVPVAEGELLYAAAGEPKKLAVVEGADHRFSHHVEQVWELFFSWLENLSL